MRNENLKNKYDVIYNGKILCTLNEKLVKKQNVSDENIEALKESHIMKHFIFEAANNTNDSATLKVLANMFERLEFEQQRLWNFPQDKTMHCWYTFPKCGCPKLDNQDRRGTNTQVISSSCPIHGTGQNPSPQ